MSADQPLSEGVVGREIVAYFAKEGRVAVDAKSLGSLSDGLQHDYEITFDSGITQAFRVTWEGPLTAKIFLITPLN